MTKVLTYQEAVRTGLEPGLYGFRAEQVPTGTYEAQLDYKVWSTRLMAIHLYYTLLTKEKIQLSVFPDKKTYRYILPGSDVDFTICPTGEVYYLQVHITPKGKAILKQVSLNRKDLLMDKNV